MSEDDRQERQRHEQESRRRREISHFRTQQRISREWIPVDKIIEWCVASQPGAGTAQAEQARILAFDRLDQSARAGEFEVGGKSQIKWLHPRFVETEWLTRDALSVFGTIRDQASYCWLPRELARQWLAAHGYPWPAHFDPAPPTSTTASAIAVLPTTDSDSSEPPAGIRTNKAAAAEQACRQWIAGLKERPANTDEAFAQARAAVAHIGPLSGRAFERAWARKAPVDWRLGGRRKKVR
jgi:hypothetical protein